MNNNHTFMAILTEIHNKCFPIKYTSKISTQIQFTYFFILFIIYCFPDSQQLSKNSLIVGLLAGLTSTIF